MKKYLTLICLIYLLITPNVMVFAGGAPPSAPQVSLEASDLIDGGSDPIDGDKIEISRTWDNITPDHTGDESDSDDDLAAILEGIDDALGTKLNSDGSGASLTGIPLDSDFGSNGLMKRTGAGTYGIASSGGTDYYTSGDEATIFNAATITDITGQNKNKIYYSDNANGDVTELALGAANTFLGSDGATSAPSFQSLVDADLPADIDPDKIGTDGDNNEKVEAANLNIQSVDLAMTTGYFLTGVDSKATDSTPATALGLLKNADADIWQAIGFDISLAIADSTNCLDVAEQTLNSGPVAYVVDCGEAAGTFQFKIPSMPENWDGGSIIIELVVISDEATPAGTIEFDMSIQARGSDELVNNTWVTTNGEIYFEDAETSDTTVDTQWKTFHCKNKTAMAAGGVGGDTLFVLGTRDSDDGSHDTSTQGIWVEGGTIYYQIDDLDEKD